MSCKGKYLAGAALAVMTAGTALGQLTPPQQPAGPGGFSQDLSPPVPRKADSPPTLTNIFVMVALGGAVIGASMIPSKRGHQD